jgi:NADH dehydrogenase
VYEGVFMTLVVGATGFLGTEICRRLAAARKPFRAMVRPTSNPGRKEILKQLGAEQVEADLKDRASLDRICRGVTAVITTSTSIVSRQEGDNFETVDLRGQTSLIDAASAAIVELYVFISVSSNVGTSGDNPLIDAKRSVENHLQRSGLTYTILRPTFFMEIWLSSHLGFDFQNAKATIYGSGQNKISYISLHDVAQFALESLSNPAARNAVLELGGPGALTPIEVVRIFEEVSGRSFQMAFLSEEDLRARKAGARNPVEQSLADLALAAARGDAIDMNDTLKKFPIHLTSVREYAKTVLGGRG